MELDIDRDNVIKAANITIVYNYLCPIKIPTMTIILLRHNQIDNNHKRRGLVSETSEKCD